MSRLGRWQQVQAQICHLSQVVDMGSLNGTMLNDRIISTSNRREGRAVRLSSDDILQLGSRTKVKVTCTPHRLAQVILACTGSWATLE